MSDEPERRDEIPVEDSGRLEEAWKRAIAEGDTGVALEAARMAQASFQRDGVDSVAGLLDPGIQTARRLSWSRSRRGRALPPWRSRLRPTRRRSRARSQSSSRGARSPCVNAFRPR